MDTPAATGWFYRSNRQHCSFHSSHLQRKNLSLPQRARVFVLLKQGCTNMVLQLCPKCKVTMKILAHLVADVAIYVIYILCYIQHWVNFISTHFKHGALRDDVFSVWSTRCVIQTLLSLNEGDLSCEREIRLFISLPSSTVTTIHVMSQWPSHHQAFTWMQGTMKKNCKLRNPPTDQEQIWLQWPHGIPDCAPKHTSQQKKVPAQCIGLLLFTLYQCDYMVCIGQACSI